MPKAFSEPKQVKMAMSKETKGTFFYEAADAAGRSLVPSLYIRKEGAGNANFPDNIIITIQDAD